MNDSRESMVDLVPEPGALRNLADDREFHAVLSAHRTLPETFAQTRCDSMSAAMLANDVRLIPFLQPRGKLASRPPQNRGRSILL